MIKFLYHEACPQCGSKNNLGIWNDGHKFCFGCRYYEPGKNSIHQIFSPENVREKNPKAFPWDATDKFPVKALKWLFSCGLTYSDFEKYGIFWSEHQQLVCWKIKSYKDELLGWQGRCFSPIAKTKYISHGLIHKDICILGYGMETLILVEDYISAIKVSAHLPCMPLFGCTINLEALQTIKKRFQDILIWLDSDKLDNARKIGLNADLIGLNSSILYTQKDPKNYSYSEIGQYLEKKYDFSTRR